ncbi:MAG: succinate dehydrogenase, cytochrome b556 subunit [Gammaproteobacteria bacterium]|jgi:succinate dehydrogenase / fumarate reductase cytochrome b subunit|nr:succinate dehydrogenase, cytochrome b556 subunit [Gammaproteobacteria bacterium]
MTTRQANRPLSPHLGVYRWQISNTLSIFHRLTGVAMSLGALVLTGWIVSIAAGPDAYLDLVDALGSPPGVLALAGWTLCFFYHLCNGVRHLFWDAGKGFEIPEARRSGIMVVVTSTLLTLVFWIAILAGRWS